MAFFLNIFPAIYSFYADLASAQDKQFPLRVEECEEGLKWCRFIYLREICQ